MKKFLFALSLVLVVSCGTNTSIVNSWRDPSNGNKVKEFKKILVVALIKDEATRRETENRIASINDKFHTSYLFLNETNLELSKEQKIKILHDENFDGLVTLRLLSLEKETSYVPGVNNSMFYGGMNGKGPLGGYGSGFNNWYEMYSVNYFDKDYYLESTNYLVETNIFSLNKNKLIWSGTSKSTNAIDLESTVNEIITEVIKEMKNDGSLAK